MAQARAQVSLGFAEEAVPEGTHMCLIYTTEEERRDSLQKFLLAGLQAGERTACFSDKVTEEGLRNYMGRNGISFDEVKTRGALALAGSSEVYSRDGVFDPDRLLSTVAGYYKEAVDMGFPASRVIGEMVPGVERLPGGDRLLEYECRVSIQSRTCPVTAVCQYDANAFDGATIMNILKVHPKMIVNGAVIHNPFFVEPEQFLSQHA